VHIIAVRLREVDCTVFPVRVCDKFMQFSGTLQAAGKESEIDSFSLCSHDRVWCYRSTSGSTIYCGPESVSLRSPTSPANRIIYIANIMVSRRSYHRAAREFLLDKASIALGENGLASHRRIYSLRLNSFSVTGHLIA
jgi:hypothetical protein